MPTKAYALTEDLVKKIEKDVKEKGFKTEKEYVENALQHFLTCKTNEVRPEMRMIVLRYADSCLKCGNKVESGSWAMYGRGVGVICLDCSVLKYGDKGLVAKYLKSRELREVIRALTVEADRLADQVEAGQVTERLTKLNDKNAELHKLVLEYFRSGQGTPDEKTVLDRVLKETNDTFEIIDGLKQFLWKIAKRRTVKTEAQ